ncbi:hypothetical protein SDC9_143185 [bioreactor metagenome]|uniref:Uncharacterized protein n=1 Tax=bioreactor metagenome TaxID=1076179 RepID=A0A645E3B9_9ZZZZ
MEYGDGTYWQSGLVPAYIKLPGEDGYVNWAESPSWAKTVFFCPAATDVAYKTSYAANYYLNRKFNDPKLSKIPNSSTTVLLVDGNGRYSLTWEHVAGGGNYAIRNRHAGSANTLFVAGHVLGTRELFYYDNSKYPHLMPVR